jgi:hypothetical protein
VAVTAKMYGLCLSSLWNKEIDWNTDTSRVMLCTSAYVPNQDTHRYKSDVTNEITGAGYTASGVGLTDVSAVYNTSTNTLTLDADDAQWTSATFTARYAVVYDSSPAGDSTRPLLGYVDFGADVSVVAGAFTVAWDPTGIFTFTVS